jgi:hypothetical protein
VNAPEPLADQVVSDQEAIGQAAELVQSLASSGTIPMAAAGDILNSLRQSGLEIDAAPLVVSRAYRLITDTSGTRHLVDGAGVRYFTEGKPGYWYIAVEGANWAAWQGIALSLRQTLEPGDG